MIKQAKFVGVVGLFAVTTFLLSYQQKKRKNIIIWNVTSRILYIVQYLLLGAFEGALLDVLGSVSSFAAQKKDHKFIKISLFPIVGVILHTSAFWITEEKTIRKISFIGSPFWLVYNLASMAYGSAIGDILTMISIGVAIYRYDIRKHQN